ncbi:MAG: hypothetical protein JNN26_06045, partial [Candidatus Obscuribacter sp.]|nr:hypothetical protein [Candidatus Obscuribacter sp.]
QVGLPVLALDGVDQCVGEVLDLVGTVLASLGGGGIGVLLGDVGLAGDVGHYFPFDRKSDSGTWFKSGAGVNCCGFVVSR